MKWYVLYVKSKQEIKIEAYINKLDTNILAFCPTRSEIKKWSDRSKKIQVPLIPSIILIKTIEQNRDKVFGIPGTIRYLFLEKKPAIVKEKEVQHLRSIAISQNIISHETQTFKLGTKMDLTAFGFKNTNGTILKTSNKTCWVILESLGYTLKLTLN